MAEVFKIDVEADINAFYVFDITGKYSLSNPEGWGLPNRELSTITAAVFNAWAPTQDPLVDTPVSFDVFPFLPNDTNFGREVLATDLGLVDIESGVWNMNVTLTTSDLQTITAEFQCYYDAKIRCCIADRKIKIEPCNIDSKCSKQTMKLEVIADNAAWAFCAGDITTANDLSKYVQLQCECCV